MIWSAFANEYSFITIATLLIGFLSSVIGQYTFLWPIGIYSCVISLLILLIEYPRGCKKNGKLNERKYQSYLAKFYVNYGTRLYTNYFFRFLLYVLLSIPCLLTLSTLLGGLNLIVTSMLYLISNFKKEKWTQPLEMNDKNESRRVLQFPTIPPPREPNFTQI